MRGSGDSISREAAREAVWQILNGMGYSEKHNDRLVEEVDAIIDDLPAADVRPVVCCKDCVYAYPYGLEIKCTKHSGKADRLGEDATYSEFHSENWYCADAQRKRGKRDDGTGRM